MAKRIHVTEPSLPSLEEFQIYLSRIWENKWLTNNGEFHNKLEEELARALKVDHISLFANGTIALIVALKSLEITGEVITSPYSFIATTHSLIWNHITPVFCDIDPSDCNIDSKKIEQLITEKTSAILPIHVYGSPCDHQTISKIAGDHNLKVIYDSAHAFGVEENNESILNNGDLSVLSFHATKVFNTFEGGAIISHTPEMKQKIDLLKNFGIQDELTVSDVGINGKMNEIQAAFGLLQLKDLEMNILKRKNISEIYYDLIRDIKGIRLLVLKDNVNYNYSYFPIIIEDDYCMTRDELYEYLKENNIFSRRYFYPLISNFSIYSHIPSSSRSKLKNSNYIADRILCLPIFPNLDHEQVYRICKLINYK